MTDTGITPLKDGVTDVDELWRYARHLEVKIDRLQTVLKPFAAVARHYAPYPADMTDMAVDYPFKLADLRAAADALTGKTP